MEEKEEEGVDRLLLWMLVPMTVLSFSSGVWRIVVFLTSWDVVGVLIMVL